MNSSEITQLYDDDYAQSYEGKFLRSGWSKADVDFELSLLRHLLADSDNWLDVACGTGYFLSQFPDVNRAGLDISPAMLAQAHAANPNVSFRAGDFRHDIAEWQNHWSLVSCMWYAYGLVDSMRELRQVIRNLAAWTAPRGVLFLPMVDASQIVRVDLPSQLPFVFGFTRIEAVVWSYVEECGKRHQDMIAPHLETMKEIVGTYFSEIEVVRYPPPYEGCEEKWRRLAIVARRKSHLTPV